MISGILKANELNEIGPMLETDRAMEMIERDVYWPKWDSPLWYMLLLEETGRLIDIPRDTFKELLNCADRQFVKVIPVKEEELGSVNLDTEVMCFCFFGNMLRLASKLDFDFFAYLPWAKKWISRYQLPDGGYNCDDAAYSTGGKSSIISTTAMLEGLIEYSRYTKDTETFAMNMQKMAVYLIKHQLYLSSAGTEIPGMNWDKVIFPRFNEYDFSRGLEAVLDFLLLTGKKVKAPSIERAVTLLNEKTSIGLAHSEKQWLGTLKTVSYYIEKPILFKDTANVPLVMKILNSSTNNEFVPAMLARVARKLEDARGQSLII